MSEGDKKVLLGAVCFVVGMVLGLVAADVQWVFAFMEWQ